MTNTQKGLSVPVKAVALQVAVMVGFLAYAVLFTAMWAAVVTIVLGFSFMIIDVFWARRIEARQAL